MGLKMGALWEVGGRWGEMSWFNEGVGGQIGDEKCISFWSHPWLEGRWRGGCGLDFVIFLTCMLIVEGGDEEARMGCWRHGWRWQRQLFAWEEEELAHCVFLLANTVVDKWVWLHNSDDCYSVKGAYYILSKLSNPTSISTQILFGTRRSLWKSLYLVGGFLRNQFQQRII